MCGYFRIGFIDFMLAGRSLIDLTTLFSPYDFKKNDILSQQDFDLFPILNFEMYFLREHNYFR